MREGMSIREWRGFSILITGGYRCWKIRRIFLWQKLNIDWDDLSVNEAVG
jgi:hypothetical protein